MGNNMPQNIKHTPVYIMLVGIILISVGNNLIQYHKLEIAKKEKIILQVYIEQLYQKVQEFLEKEKSRKEFRQTKTGGEIESITITD